MVESETPVEGEHSVADGVFAAHDALAFLVGQLVCEFLLVFRGQEGNLDRQTLPDVGVLTALHFPEAPGPNQVQDDQAVVLLFERADPGVLLLSLQLQKVFDSILQVQILLQLFVFGLTLFFRQFLLFVFGKFLSLMAVFLKLFEGLSGVYNEWAFLHRVFVDCLNLVLKRFVLFLVLIL